MRVHITTIVKRYKNHIHTWEVVNETFRHDGTFVNSRYYQILGKDFVKYAFRFAREANPDAKLYITDNNLIIKEKRNGMIRLIKELQAEDIKVDGIGIQIHTHLGFSKFNELEQSILAFHELGCKVSITEMEISVLPMIDHNNADIFLNPELRQSANPFPSALPERIALRQYDLYRQFFQLFLKYQDKIERVTLWGISDAESVNNNYPIFGRTDYPLLWDRNYQPKPIVKDLISLARK
jgi:endo-1,4-beta-xylanase